MFNQEQLAVLMKNPRGFWRFDFRNTVEGGAHEIDPDGQRCGRAGLSASYSLTVVTEAEPNRRHQRLVVAVEPSVRDVGCTGLAVQVVATELHSCAGSRAFGGDVAQHRIHDVGVAHIDGAGREMGGLQYGIDRRLVHCRQHVG